MSQRIERDHQRFRKLVRGKVKSNLSKYISRGEMIGKKGKDSGEHPPARDQLAAVPLREQGLGRHRRRSRQPSQPLGD